MLVSRVGGLQDAVEDGVEGRVLPPGDVDAWAGAIRELVEDRRRLTRLVPHARARARGFAAMGHDLVAIYREVATGPAIS